MTESVRKRNSKWDLKAETDQSTEIRQDNVWSSKGGDSIIDKELKPGWGSTKDADNHDPKWSNVEDRNSSKPKDISAWSTWEPLSGNRGSEKDDMNRLNGEDTSEIPQTMTGWGGDPTYSSNMSPGLDAWRQQNRSHSPKSGRSRAHRSRSRSPPYGFKREAEGWVDRSRRGSGVSARPCNDFAAGRCRRGSHCRFLHQDKQDYEHKRHMESASLENWRGRRDGNRHSESGPVDSLESRHEKEGSFRSVNTEEARDDSWDKFPHGYRSHLDGDREKHESQRNNRSTNICNDFLRGRCYRGSSCKYVHDGTSSDEHGGWSTKGMARERTHDRKDAYSSFDHEHRREARRNSDIPCKYFAAGNCRNGEYCRFSHDGAGQCSPKGRPQEDKWSNDVDNEIKPWGGSQWSDAVAVSSDIAKSNQWRAENSDEKTVIPEPMTSNRSTYDGWGHNLDNENKMWGGPKVSDKETDKGVQKSSMWNEDDVARMGNPESRATKRSTDDRWGLSLDKKSRTCAPTWNGNEADRDVHKSPQWNENNSRIMSISESCGNRKSLDGTNAVDRERYLSQTSQSQIANEINLPYHEQNVTQDVSLGQQQLQHVAVTMQKVVSENSYIQQHPTSRGDAATALPCKDSNRVGNTVMSQNEVIFSANILPMVSVPGQSFNQSGQSIGTQLHSNFNMNGQNQQILLPQPPNSHNFNLGDQLQQEASGPPSNPHCQPPFHLGESIHKQGIADAQMSQVTSGISLTNNVVTSEQVAQITNLSASLAQIFGSGQQLPQIYASLNPSNVPSHSTGSVAPVTIFPNQHDQTNWSQKPYDPIGDSVESKKHDNGDRALMFSSNPIEQKNSAIGESPAPLKNNTSSITDGPNSGDTCKNGILEEILHHGSHELKQQPVADSETRETNNLTVEKSKKEQENDHQEDVNADGQADEEGKRNKEAKGMRMFKFALVEFVKEILKPTWKEGQMSKEAHKTIVKKVVDKVTSTLQGAQVPQTQEKIDHYLSYSKAKLTKLVQAYVEKYLKT
ncbi:PREDICTED: zinc finger CCCH domain-containing protein 55 [Nelumbo nucifera]|uniref:Zinc finger CCCH domain-containing protein 55 n=1 Tax=Nelumbo nucifera TaxID=4432 RepID=A0A1U7Z1B2_NELNU|nr:PREDICTED: zinc finger CCCH domain-containing protein 55 [Nelumbo nucifera]